MSAHIIDGEFQSDKYPTCPRGKVPLSVKDSTAQDLLWEYAQRRRSVDAEFASDLETALLTAGFDSYRLVCVVCGHPRHEHVGQPVSDYLGACPSLSRIRHDFIPYPPKETRS